MYRVRCILILLLTLIILCIPARGADQPDQAKPPRVKILFLGDNGHHVPLMRLRDIYSNFARRGIDFTYTDRLQDITPQNLARYDALFVYANTERIDAQTEKAILDYVRAGHGYIPVHCASYCFLNSKPLTELTGARFKSHGTGTFKETFAAPDNEILKGLKPIESWDETYVHEMHNDNDRTILAYRVDDRGKEPYTWSRTEGKGRVFYTAWGHDQRTWGNVDFQDLVERGIRWACAGALESRKAAAAAPQTLKPFEYEEAEVPNYPAGQRW